VIAFSLVKLGLEFFQDIFWYVLIDRGQGLLMFLVLSCFKTIVKISIVKGCVPILFQDCV